MHDLKWRDAEKKLAHRLFEQARVAELAEIIANFKSAAAAVSDPDQLWALVDEMHTRRRAFDQKYDYRYSVLLTVFAHLLAEGRVAEADLQGFGDEKLAAIRHTAGWLAR